MIPYSTTLCLNFELTFLLLPEKFHEHLNQNWYKWWRSFRITIFYHLIFWSTLYISMQKCKASFLCKNARQVFLMHIFYSFDFFTIVCYHCDTRSHGNLFFFFFQICILERTFQKILLFGHQVIMHLKHCNYVEKIWSLVNYISWGLIGHITIRIRIISAKGGFPEYLLSAMWSFVHQCIFK